MNQYPGSSDGWQAVNLQENPRWQEDWWAAKPKQTQERATESKLEQGGMMCRKMTTPKGKTAARQFKAPGHIILLLYCKGYRSRGKYVGLTRFSGIPTSHLHLDCLRRWSARLTGIVFLLRDKTRVAHVMRYTNPKPQSPREKSTCKNLRPRHPSKDLPDHH